MTKFPENDHIPNVPGEHPFPDFTPEEVPLYDPQAQQTFEDDWPYSDDDDRALYDFEHGGYHDADDTSAYGDISDAGYKATWG